MFDRVHFLDAGASGFVYSMSTHSIIGSYAPHIEFISIDIPELGHVDKILINLIDAQR